MKLQTKVVLILSGIWIGTCLFIYFDSKYTLDQNYQSLEENLDAKDVERVHMAITNIMSALELFTIAYSTWDEQYAFMKNKNQQFINSNFVASTYTTSKINFYVCLDTHGKYFYGKEYDLKKNIFNPIPPELISRLESYAKNPTANLKLTGFVKIPEGYTLISLLPILPSNGTPPPDGSVLSGYYLTNDFIKTISKTVDLNVSFIPLPLQTNNKMAKTANQQLSDNKNDYYISQTFKTNYGFTYLKDIAGNPIAMLEVTIPREFYQQTISSFHRYLIFIMILGVITIISMLMLIKTLVLNKVFNISKQVVDINSTASFYKRIKISGSDELSIMATSINSMLELIELTQEQLKYRISRRTKELEKLSCLNRNLFTEISKQRTIESKFREEEKLLRQMAYYDNLTGLPNRNFFNELLLTAIEKAKHHQKKVAILFIDIDKFKKINDTYGHDIGDKLLKLVAICLKKSISENDAVSRIGGDEFIAFLTNITDKNQIDEIVVNIFNELKLTDSMDNLNIKPYFSLGISIFPDDATSLDALINQADLAMYYAKKKEGNIFYYFGAIKQGEII